MEATTSRGRSRGALLSTASAGRPAQDSVSCCCFLDSYLVEGLWSRWRTSGDGKRGQCSRGNAGGQPHGDLEGQQATPQHSTQFDDVVFIVLAPLLLELSCNYSI